MGEKWEKNGTNNPFVTVPCRFPEAEDLPLRALCKIWYPVSAWKNDKNGYPPNGVLPGLVVIILDKKSTNSVDGRSERSPKKWC